MRINPNQNQPIKINNIEFEDVDLGAIVSQQWGGIDDMRGRVSKARSAFTKLGMDMELQQHLQEIKYKTIRH